MSAPRAPRASRLPIALLLGAIGFYALVSLRHLDVLPPVYEDEPWQASTGWKMARDGVFGSDLFAGLQGMEDHTYGYMPLHPLFLAAAFEVGGVGLLQARLENVAVGLVVLLLTFELGRRVHSAEMGALAAATLVALRWSYAGRYQATGIVFLDMARIARYDMEVPAFGLGALVVWTVATRSGRLRWFAASGLLVGLASLSQLHGLFWVPSLLVLGLWQRVGWRSLAAAATAFVVPWLGYAAFVAADPADWAAQMTGYAPRFQLLDPRWYWSNLVREPVRYTQALGAEGWYDWLRPGLLLGGLGVPATLVHVARVAIGRSEGDASGARVLLVPTVLVPFFFATLIWLKFVNYLVVIAPFVALTLAWGLLTAWRAARERGSLWVRVALLVGVSAVGIETVSRVAVFERRASTTTPYRELAATLRRSLEGAHRILIIHHYWFGLEDLDVRTWAAPVLAARDAPDPGSALQRELDRFDPDAIVVDRRIEMLFADLPWVEEAAEAWLDRHGFALATGLEDGTYGAFEIFRPRDGGAEARP